MLRSTQNPRSAVPRRIKLSRWKRSHWSVRIQVRITATLPHSQQHQSPLPAGTILLQGQPHWSVRIQVRITATLPHSQQHQSPLPASTILLQGQPHWSVRIQVRILVRITATLRHSQQHQSPLPTGTILLQGQPHWSVRLQAAAVAVLVASLRRATTTLPQLKRSVNAMFHRRQRRAPRLGLPTVVATWVITQSCDTRTALERCVRCM